MQVWAHYEEQPVEEVMPVLEEKERSASYKPVFVTEIDRCFKKELGGQFGRCRDMNGSWGGQVAGYCSNPAQRHEILQKGRGHGKEEAESVLL